MGFGLTFGTDATEKAIAEVMESKSPLIYVENELFIGVDAHSPDTKLIGEI